MKLNTQQLNAIIKETNWINAQFLSTNIPNWNNPQFKLFNDIFDNPKLLASWGDYVNGTEIIRQRTYQIGKRGKLSIDSELLKFKSGRIYDALHKKWL